MTSDEHLYRCLKKMECTAQGMLFEIPLEGSPAALELQIDAGEAWKMGALIHCLSWFRDKATTAAGKVYLRGRPDLVDNSSEGEEHA